MPGRVNGGSFRLRGLEEWEALMANQGERKPTLGDLMVAVAAVAAGIALDKHTHRPPALPSCMVQSASSFQMIRSGIGYVSPVLIAGTVACMVIRLGQPRPSLRQLADFPGAMAVGSAFMVIAFGYSWMLIQLALG